MAEMTRRRWFNRMLLLTTLTAMVGCSDTPTTPTSTGVFTKTDLVVGKGDEALTNSTVVVNYAGWLYDTSKPDGKGDQFDAAPGFTVTLGAGSVIKGWDQGIPGMRVGGQRRLIIPPDLAYGEKGSGSKIGKNATLLFDIYLASVTN